MKYYDISVNGIIIGKILMNKSIAMNYQNRNFQLDYSLYKKIVEDIFIEAIHQHKKK